jgi:hypothetical protein
VTPHARQIKLSRRRNASSRGSFGIWCVREETNCSYAVLSALRASLQRNAGLEIPNRSRALRCCRRKWRYIWYRTIGIRIAPVARERTHSET